MLHFASVVAAVHQRYTPLLFLHFTWAFLCPVKLLGGLCTRPAFGGTWRFGIFTTLFGGQGETERGHIFHSLFLALHFTFSPLGPVRNHVSTILLLGHPQPHNSTGVSATTQSEYVETGCTLNFCFFSMRWDDGLVVLSRPRLYLDCHCCSSSPQQTPHGLNAAL